MGLKGIIIQTCEEAHTDGNCLAKDRQNTSVYGFCFKSLFTQKVLIIIREITNRIFHLKSYYREFYALEDEETLPQESRNFLQ